MRESLRELRDAAVRIAAAGIVAADNWWRRALGRGAAWDEGRDTALANAAMVAHDMGRPDIRQAINRLIPDGSPFIPFDDPRYPKNIHVHMRFNDEDPDRAARSFLSELAKVRREGSY